MRGAAIAGAGIAVVLGGIWIMRLPIGAFILKQQLSAPGAPAALTLTRLDFGGMALEDIRVGPGAAPDLAAKSLALDFGWSPGFRLAAVRLDGARLKVRINEKGFSAGALDRYLKGGAGPAQPASIPDLSLTVHNTTAVIETPLGAFAATAEAQGALLKAFTGRIDIAPRDTQGPAGGAEALEAHFAFHTADERIAASLTGGAETIAWRRGAETGELSNAALSVSIAAPVALNDAHAEARFTLAEAQIAGTLLRGASAEAQLDAGGIGAGFAPKSWNASFRAKFDAAKGATIDAGAISADASLHGDNARLSGDYVAKLGRGGAFGFAAPSAKLDGPFSGDFSRSPWSFTAQGELDAPQASIDQRTRRAIIGAAPGLGGTPLAPLIAAAKPALDRALARFSLRAPLSFAWANGQGRLSASGPAALNAASGARFTIAPLSGAGPSFGIVLPSGAFDGGAIIDIAGSGLPQAKLSVARLHYDKSDFVLQGQAQIASWRADASALQGAPLDFDIKSTNGAGEARLKGDLTLSGPIAGLRLVDAHTPLNLTARWGEGFRAGPAGGVCQDIRTTRIEAAGLVFDKATLLVCPAEGGVFAAADKAGNYSGGFSIGRMTLSGRMDGAPVRPARLSITRIDSRLGGGAAGMRLDTIVQAPALAIDWDQTRRVSLRGKAVTANLLTTAKGWRVAGDLRDVWIEDNTAPARVEAFNGDLIIEPKGDEAVLRVVNGAGRVFDPHEKKLIQPLALRAVEVNLDNGKATGHGAIRLEKPDAALGQFTLTHDLESGKGDAAVTAQALTFSPALQPYQISETVLGVVANVEGPVDADIGAHWSGADFRTDARFDLKALNMATAALGPVEGVSGVVVFDDFAKLTTPPGQRITVAKINPGIEVKDGIIHLQMKPDLNVALESAIWPFAGGRLSVLPTTFDFNSKQTRFTLDLAEIDVNELIKQLNVKDLSATGKVQGRFPLVFADGKGRIENGKLQAAPGGGTIQYNSDFQQTGVAQLAFDALRSFRYDDLTLDLSGDLDDEIITSIAFSGVNREPVSQSAGPAQVKLVGIPFKFNVKVRAPFMALSRTAASITDARGLLNPAETTAAPQKAP
ncbi:MAG: YdbH domain-containing protein [Pseudomonadota bacterium]